MDGPGGGYINAAGGIECWGIDDGSSNDHGQVSDTPTGSGYTVSAAGQHNCAINTSGSIECWGINDAGSIECWGKDQYGQVSGAPTGCRGERAHHKW